MSVRFTLIEGTAADNTQAKLLIEGLFAQYLLGDKGYDSNDMIELARKLVMGAVIPPRKNRREQRLFDDDL